MITLTKNENTIVFTFNGNDHYLQDGTIEVPVNSLTLVTDNSQMANFKKSASNDIFISATYAELGMSKSELESWFKENACGSTGGCDVPSNLSEWTYDDNGNITSMVYTAETIPNNAYTYAKLTSVTISNSVRTIGNKAFEGCGSIINIEIPNSVTSIGEGAFSSCYGLTSINIPSGVTSISNEIFRNCSSLTGITIPDSVTTIGSWAFQSCTSLSSINIPNGVTTINANTFSDCHSLTNITIPDSVTTIGNSAFYRCSGLTSITISDGVTSIGQSALSYCSGLTSITIPSSVTNIGAGAFRYCTSLTSVTCLATTPPTMLNSVFDNTNNCPIYVPAASVDAYKAAARWSTYANRIQAIP